MSSADLCDMRRNAATAVVKAFLARCLEQSQQLPGTSHTRRVSPVGAWHPFLRGLPYDQKSVSACELAWVVFWEGLDKKSDMSILLCWFGLILQYKSSVCQNASRLSINVNTRLRSPCHKIRISVVSLHEATPSNHSIKSLRGMIFFQTPSFIVVLPLKSSK